MAGFTSSSLLILIKHSLPEIQPDVPPHRWLLSEEGRRRCCNLADSIAVYAPDVIITSDEPKATETGQIVARLLNKPFKTASNLHEHQREREPFEQDISQFQQHVREFFEKPDTRVYGEETADQAHTRFSEAVSRALSEHPSETVVIVAHGTVISLLVSRANPIAPFELWGQLGLPAYVVVSRQELRLLETVSLIK